MDHVSDRNSTGSAAPRSTSTSTRSSTAPCCPVWTEFVEDALETSLARNASCCFQSSGSRKCGRESGSPINRLREKTTQNRLDSRDAKIYFFCSVAACFRKPVTHRSKIFVPRLREAGNDLFRGSTGDLHSGMDNISPSMHARAFSGMLFEVDPLRQHHPQRMVDPAHFVRSISSRLPASHGRPSRHSTSP